MRFLNPAGLWLLLGIPILIIIYLIKAQHEDRPVSSTYIWHLSSRFMKKRLPMQKIKKILAFVMQLAVIVALALIAARPAFVNGEACDYIAIIDASASMQIRDEEDVSRFEYALAAVEDLSSKINEGHTLSVIVSGDSPYYLVRSSTSVNEVKIALNHLSCSLGESNISDALSLAELVCSESSNSKIFLYSDCEYSAENIEVINLNKNEWDVEVSSLSSKEKRNETEFVAKLTSYNKDASVTVGLKIDGVIKDAQIVECKKDTETEVTFTIEDLKTYDTAEVFIETDDGLSYDNSFALCSKSEKTYGVLLVSESPLYIESALNALGNCNVTVVSNLEDAELSGQDLYVFDGIVPEEYPTDGSVILFGTNNLPSGLTLGETFEKSSELTKDNTISGELYNDLSFEDTVVTNYTELLCGTDWEKLLFCENSVVLASKELETGMHFSVISFDVHDSNLPMQTCFVVLMRNLVSYSVPEMLKKTDYNVGDTIKLTVLPAATNMYLEYPDETIKVLSLSSRYISVNVDTVGIYTACMSTDDGGEYGDFFVHIKTGEIGLEDGETLTVENFSQTGVDTKEAISEVWFWIAVAILAIVLIEWWWYYREQY